VRHRTASGGAGVGAAAGLPALAGVVLLCVSSRPTRGCPLYPLCGFPGPGVVGRL